MDAKFDKIGQIVLKSLQDDPEVGTKSATLRALSNLTVRENCIFEMWIQPKDMMSTPNIEDLYVTPLLASRIGQISCRYVCFVICISSYSTILSLLKLKRESAVMKNFILSLIILLSNCMKNSRILKYIFSYLIIETVLSSKVLLDFRSYILMKGVSL